MAEKKIYLSVKDYSVSGEEFKLLHDEDLEMLETSPCPSLDKLPKYYESEDYISHTDNKRNLIEKVYHLIKWISLRKKLKLINSFKANGKSLLDVGCGTGDFLELTFKKGWEILGIEPNDRAREMANKKTKGVVFGTEKLQKIKANSFDVITLWHVFEHLHNPEVQLALFRELLKEEGVLIIAVPNFKSYDAAYYKNYWAAYDVPRHLWHFSQGSIERLTERRQMKITQIHPMIFDAFYVSILSEKYKTGKINPFKAFWVGCRSNLKGLRNGEYSSLIYIIKKRKIQF